MTHNNYDKKTIRGRMAITGESYSVAARALGFAPVVTWKALDAIIGNFRKGRLYVVGAQLSVGTTQLGIELARMFSAHTQQATYVSLEMTTQEVEYRLDSMPFREEQAAASVTPSNANIVIIDRLPQGMISLREKVLAVAQTTSVVVIDYVQLLVSFDNRELRYRDRADMVIQELRQLARDANIPIVALSRVLRSTEDNESVVSVADRFMRQFNMASAHAVMLLTRDSDSEKLICHVIQNHNGECISIELS